MVVISVCFNSDCYCWSVVVVSVQVFSRVSGYSMATLFLFILILVLFIGLIIKDISNPILRMAIIVIFGGSAAFTVVTS